MMLFAQQTTSPTFMSIMAGFPWWVWIAFGGMLLSAVFGVTQMIIKHRERIEMIRQGHIPPPDDEG